MDHNAETFQRRFAVLQQDNAQGGLELMDETAVKKTKKRRALAAAIEETDEFSIPTISPATDEFGQHYVFEFDALDEDDDDGAAGD